MPETSSAPATLWAVIDPTALYECYMDADGISPTGLVEHTTDEARARRRAAARDEAFNRTKPERKHLAVEYVRRDVALPPLADVTHVIAPHIAHSGVQRWNLTDAGKAVRKLLTRRLERAACSEGDNDER